MASACKLERGEMVSVSGMTLEAVQATLDAQDSRAWISTVMTPTTLTVAAPAGSLLAGSSVDPVAHEHGPLRGLRGSRVVLRKVHVDGAFHTPMMSSATHLLNEAMQSVEWRDATVPVVSNVDGAPYTAAADVRGNLLRQLTHVVQWHSCVDRLVKIGVRRFIVGGADTALAATGRRLARDASRVEHGVPSIHYVMLR